NGTIFEMVNVGGVVHRHFAEQLVTAHRPQHGQQHQRRQDYPAAFAQVPHQAGAGTTFSASCSSRTSRINSMMPKVASPMPSRTKPAGMKPSATPMKNVLAGISRPMISSQAFAR